MKNVIWFMVDQMRSQATGYMGDPNVRTPNLNNFAITGRNFKNAVTNYPLCCPARASMLTGLYSHKTGVMGHEYQLNNKVKTVADYFNDEGYNTMYFGKWHLLGHKEAISRGGTCNIPKEHRAGFKTFLGYDNNNSPYDVYLNGNKGDKEVDLFKLDKYETESLTDLAIENIKENKDNPFFMVVSVQPPHDPYIAPPEYLNNYSTHDMELRKNVPPYKKVEDQAKKDLKGYYGAIEAIDYNFGRILDTLDELGLYEDTHVIFLSDHGDMHGSHGMFRKTNPYEESIRVPFIIGGGGKMQYDDYINGDDSNMISTVDIMTTTLGLCDIKYDENLDGKDFSGNRMRSHKKIESDYAYIQGITPTYHHDSYDLKWRCLVTKDGHKYVCSDKEELLYFDLNKDEYELVNNCHNSVYVDKRAELNNILKEMVTKYNDDFTVPKVNGK